MSNESMFEGVSSRAVRILRAKVGELEHIVRVHYDLAEETDQDVTFEVNLAADIALVADILAEFIEWTTHDTEPPWTPWADPTSMTGHAREATEHEVASPPPPGQPTGPTEQADVQGEPTTSPRPPSLIRCDDAECPVAWAFREPPRAHYHPRPAP